MHLTQFILGGLDHPPDTTCADLDRDCDHAEGLESREAAEGAFWLFKLSITSQLCSRATLPRQIELIIIIY